MAMDTEYLQRLNAISYSLSIHIMHGKTYRLQCVLCIWLCIQSHVYAQYYTMQLQRMD